MNFNNKEREMSEQKFKVVKCLEYIPEKLWGMVLEEEEHPSRSNAECDNALGYCLSDTDTFPLPEQGDKVEFSMNGLVKWDWATFICYYDGKFILKSQIDDIIARYYIRPIEAKECKPTLSTMPFEPLMQKYDTKLRNGQLYFVASGYVMMREDAQRICDELNRMLKEFKDE